MTQPQKQSHKMRKSHSFSNLRWFCLLESDSIHLCYHLLFSQGIQMSLKKGLSWTSKVLLSLVKKIWQWCQGVILIPTPDCSGERRGFQAVTDSGRSCSTSQTEKPGDGSCELDVGWLHTVHALWLKTTQNGFGEQCVRELRGPVLVLLHISRRTRKKGELTYFADPSYHNTPHQKNILTCGMKGGIINSVFPLKIKQKDWMTEKVVTYCLSLFRQHPQKSITWNVNDFQLLLLHDGFFKEFLLLQLYLTFFSNVFACRGKHF